MIVVPEDRFGSLHSTEILEVTQGSGRKVIWACECGRTCQAEVRKVLSGHTKSCGKCSTISAAEMATRRFGKLRQCMPIDTLPGSSKRVRWVCECGHTTTARIESVVQGRTTSCGKCSEFDPTDKVFGHLHIKRPQKILPQSHQKLTWVCTCGNETDAAVYSVSTGNTASCGKCWDHIYQWYERHRNELMALKCPIVPTDFVPGAMLPLEPIIGLSVPFRARCLLCGLEYKPLLKNIRRGVSLTCGCTSHKTSAPVHQLIEFITSLGIQAVFEHSIGEWKYDIGIPSLCIVIEFNGLRWHSSRDSRDRDLRKYKAAVASGYEFIALFEDEWRHSRTKVEALLCNRLGRSKHIKLRPTMCSIKSVDFATADRFHAEFHYIGPCRPTISYSVLFNGSMIACLSLSHPTRQSRHQWELVRMTSNPAYRVHGIWSKLLHIFIQEHSPYSIVSFSDNRLYTGSVYGLMGFQRDGQVLPDYYWVKQGKRFHKSSLRKKNTEKASGMTERELREAQGYRKIWDFGKTRWVWCSINHVKKHSNQVASEDGRVPNNPGETPEPTGYGCRMESQPGVY